MNVKSSFNSKSIIAACLFSLASFSALSAQADTKPETYTYGEHLDIKKVVAQSEQPGNRCGVVNAHLSYLDSMNTLHDLNYLKFGQSCLGQN